MDLPAQHPLSYVFGWKGSWNGQEGLLRAVRTFRFQAGRPTDQTLASNVSADRSLRWHRSCPSSSEIPVAQGGRLTAPKHPSQLWWSWLSTMLSIPHPEPGPVLPAFPVQQTLRRKQWLNVSEKDLAPGRVYEHIWKADILTLLYTFGKTKALCILEFD